MTNQRPHRCPNALATLPHPPMDSGRNEDWLEGTRTLAWSALGMILALALAATACGSPDAKSPDNDNAAASSLTDLGVETELGPRTDPEGSDLPAEHHPLSRRHRTIAPLAELYIAGATVNGRSEGLLDDQKAGLALLHGSDDTSWTQNTLAAGKGDVDGDGYDEIVVVYHVAADRVLKLRVVDRDGESYTERTHTIAQNVDAENSTQHNLPPMTAIALGDLDGDGRDEVAFGLGNTLYLIDDSQAGFAIKERLEYPAPDENGLALLQLGFGDFDGNGRAQLLVSLSLADETLGQGSVSWYRYDTTLADASDHGELTLRDGYTTHIFGLARMAVADVDGDGLDEAVFRAVGPSGQLTFLMDDQQAEHETKHGYAHTDPWHRGMAIAALDANGDGVKEVLSGKDLLEYNPRNGEWTVKGTLPLEWHGETCTGCCEWIEFWCDPTYTPNGNPAHALSEVWATGDFNADFREELAVKRGGQIQFWGIDQAGHFVQRADALPINGAAKAAPALVAANVDTDSLVVRYTGEQELLFSAPKVIAVMAAPPTWKNKGQNIDGSGTTFGRMQATETEHSESMGFSVGASVGFEQEFSIFGIEAASFEITASFEYAMNWNTARVSSLETSYAFTSGPGEDKVVFTAVPYDVYYYEVVSAPDADAVGSIVTISVPRDAQTLSVTREFYNAHNGDAPDIDESVLYHEVGDPWSYPTAEDRNDMMASRGGWMNPNPVTVGEGTGAATMTIATTETNVQGMSYDFNASLEVTVGAGGVKAGASAGFQYGCGYSVSASQGLFVEGSIGEIPAEHYNGENQYTAGLFAYPHETVAGHQFLVINYWVE